MWTSHPSVAHVPTGRNHAVLIDGFTPVLAVPTTSPSQTLVHPSSESFAAQGVYLTRCWMSFKLVYTQHVQHTQHAHHLYTLDSFPRSLASGNSYLPVCQVGPSSGSHGLLETCLWHFVPLLVGDSISPSRWDP